MKHFKTGGHAIFALLLMPLLVLSGCQKDRTPFLNVDDSRDLQTMSTYEGKEFSLKTKAILKSAASGAKVKIKDTRTKTANVVHNFDFVDYEANDPLNLTDKTAMLGRPNFLYGIRYVFDGNLLKVMKVSNAVDLAADEIASAVKLDDGRLMVPIVSYNVTYYSQNRARNELNEETSRLEAVVRPTKADATNFKIDYTSKTRAVFLSKTTVFPSNFFDGADGHSSDWFFSFTVVGQNYKDNHDILAMQSSTDKYGRLATKVRAKKLEDRILFYNLGVDSRTSATLSSNPAAQSTVVSLAAQYQDFRMKESGQTSLVQEEAYTENAWDQRAYVNLDLQNVNLPGFSMNGSQLLDIQLDDGYISFTVKYESGIGGAQGGLDGIVRFSFLNVNTYMQKMAIQGANPYQPKIYFPEDQKLFGFFATIPDYVHTVDQSSELASDRHVLINRYNPTRSQIEYRLSQNSPAWMDEVVLDAEQAWNQALAQAGIGFRIHSSDNGQVLRGVPGDLRYSLINTISDLDEGTPFEGVAMSLVDPNSGEIVSATANVTLNDAGQGTLQYTQYMLYNYVRAKMGLLDSKYVVGLPTIPSLSIFVDTAKSMIRAAGDALGLSVRHPYTVYDSSTRKFLKGFNLVTDHKRPLQLTLSNHSLFEDRFDMVNGDLSQIIEKNCPDLKSYVDSLKGQLSSLDPDREASLTQACALIISKPFVLATVLHEMGHTLGLRHNFYGSADFQNFYAPVDELFGKQSMRVQWTSSSIMDYVPFNTSTMIQPGTYDIAALRWGYTDLVESKSGSLLKTDATKPTRPQVQAQMKTYKYCSDEDIDDLPNDPMCARFDAGSTPTEVVKNLIFSYDAAVANQNTRLDRANVGDMETLSLARQEQYFQPLLHFYEKWRLLLAGAAGTGNEYLENIDTKEKYDALLKQVLDPNIVGSNQAAWNLEYKKSADLIFAFFTRIAFLPDYSCVASRNLEDQSTIELFTFSGIQKTIYNSTGKTPQNCADESVKSFLQKTKQAQVVGEVGYAFENRYQDLSVNLINQSNYQPIDKPEVVGIALDRLFAMNSLTSRNADLMDTKRTGYAPALMDEYPYAQALGQKVIDRLTKGVSLADLGVLTIGNQKVDVRKVVSPNFLSEKQLLNIFMSQFVDSLAIPNKPVVTNQRQQIYHVVPSYMLDEGTSDGRVCVTVNSIRLCATNETPPAKLLVKKFQRLQGMASARMIDDAALKRFIELVTPLIPAAGHGQQLTCAFMDEVEKIFDHLSDEDQAIAAQLQLLKALSFSTEESIWTQGAQLFLQHLDDLDISVAAKHAKIKEYKKTTMLEMAKKIAFADPDSKKDAAQDQTNYIPLDVNVLTERLKKTVPAVNKLVKSYQADPAEFNAQADILMSSLLMSGE